MAILTGVLFGILIMQPLVLSLQMNYLQGDENWWKYLPESYQEIFNFNDENQILMNLLFALLGIALALMVAVRKRIFKLKRRSKNSRR
ncbi:hypothetical protein RM549_14000 [Salegentibacter sp. F188]|uniref:DUF4321 domain-containing protein n=1 Tax=Autumnicola patrickiae TaxID=3075591 RepID=A0ABU3E4I9_9FLAO|nr:hypothetical protein [Salegentibacter sp. F188]MDT0690907.1 hypothetical protein [Salegentibacter sp. F188]